MILTLLRTEHRRRGPAGAQQSSPKNPLPVTCLGVVWNRVLLETYLVQDRELWMSDDALQRQADIARLHPDLRAAKAALLSAQCAAHRLRLQYRLHDIVSFRKRTSLEPTIESCHSLYRCFPHIASQLR